MQGFCSLRIQPYAFVEIQLFGFLQAFYHDGMPCRLAYQPQHLGMSAFPVDDDLFLRIVVAVVFLLNAFLQLQHHRAGGIYDFDVVPLCGLIRFGRLTVCPEQHFGIVQAAELFVVDGH